MIKLVAADFDGTLLPYGEKRISDKAIECIKTMVKSGVTFAVASGRTYSELRALLSNVADDIYFICDDGALAVKNDKIIFKKQFSRESTKTFFENDFFENVIFYSIDKAYIFRETSAPLTYGKTPCRISRHIELTEDVFKITATVKKPGLVNESSFRYHYSNGSFAEFVSPYAHKGVALADLQMRLGISKFETLAMGDADNDIAMMAHAKYSCCIGHRSDALKSSSSYFSETAEPVLEGITNHIK